MGFSCTASVTGHYKFRVAKSLDPSTTVGFTLVLVHTVSQLAKHCQLSRSTVLYYESIGLLQPAVRTESNYRLYGERELQRLEQIKLYRSVGVSVKDIRAVLNAPRGEFSGVLKRRLSQLEKEIEALQAHQRVILKLLNMKTLRRKKDMTKDKWVAVMKDAGFTEDDMHRWHRQFEKSAPTDHQEFLQFLNIPTDEISRIREWSKKN
nr:MerR family transcriptional regulator [Candidatus Koribacter versatilis]